MGGASARDRIRTAFGECDISALHVPWQGGDAAPRRFVLLHGIGMAGNTFADLADLLSAGGEVWAPDLPGFGHSPELPTPLDIPQSADLMVRWMTEAGVASPVTLVGHSMGTQVAAELAVRHPEAVERLVLMAPTVDASARSAPAQALRMAADLSDESLKVLGLGLVNYVRVGPRWFASKLGIMLEHHIEQVLPEVQAPTLVLRGSEDKVCPQPWVRRCAQLVNGASYLQLPGVGHETMIECPKPAAEAIIEFLQVRAVSGVHPSAKRGHSIPQRGAAS